MNDFNSLLDTIAAVSTPRGKGGVALIRISGPDTVAVMNRIFTPLGKLRPDEKPRFEIFGTLHRPDGCERPLEYTDSGLCCFFAGPASFTGSDTAEICCHGGALVTSAVLEDAILAGARQAEAGEFTRRAFAAGKISLPEAEALGLLLEANTEEQLRLSHSGMNGKLTAACEKVHSDLMSILTDLYARIDFPEEDLGSIPMEEVCTRTEALLSEIDTLRASYKTGKAIAQGVSTVICGRTNAGKSTLYNLISGSDDAIVTDIAGTTRDVISSVVSFGGVTLNLCDTAGIRAETDDKVERIGIERALSKIDAAELVLFLIDSTRAPDADDMKLAGKLKNAHCPVIALFTKCDIGTENGEAYALWQSFDLKLRISAATGEGRDELAALISSLFRDGKLDITSDPIVSSARQYDTLGRCRDSLWEAIASLREGYTADVISVCLEEACTALSELDGRGHGAVSADVIDGIFAKFCVGK